MQLTQQGACLNIQSRGKTDARTNAVCANVTYGNGVLLVAIWVEWCVTHPKEFQRAEDNIVEKVEETSAETPGDPESAPKVLS